MIPRADINLSLPEQQQRRALEAPEGGQRTHHVGAYDPRDTQTVLGIVLSAPFNNVVRGADTFGVFRM